MPIEYTLNNLLISRFTLKLTLFGEKLKQIQAPRRTAPAPRWLQLPIPAEEQVPGCGKACQLYQSLDMITAYLHRRRSKILILAQRDLSAFGHLPQVAEKLARSFFDIRALHPPQVFPLVADQLPAAR